MGNFITNSGAKNLGGRISSLIDKSNELKFLVGFFYFSGLKEIIDAIKRKPDLIVKILVGLQVDRTIHGLVEYAVNS